MKYMHYLIIIILALNVSACARVFRPQVGPPWMQDVLQGAPKGPEMFQKGWRDGCQTGISSGSNHWQKFFYTFTQDYRLVNNNEYYTGWRLARTYCDRYVYQYYKRAL